MKYDNIWYSRHSWRSVSSTLPYIISNDHIANIMRFMNLTMNVGKKGHQICYNWAHHYPHIWCIISFKHSIQSWRSVSSTLPYIISNDHVANIMRFMNLTMNVGKKGHQICYNWAHHYPHIWCIISFKHSIQSWRSVSSTLPYIISNDHVANIMRFMNRTMNVRKKGHQICYDWAHHDPHIWCIINFKHRVVSHFDLFYHPNMFQIAFYLKKIDYKIRQIFEYNLLARQTPI